MKGPRAFSTVGVFLAVFGALLLLIPALSAQSPDKGGHALVVEVEGPIGPATVRHIENGILEAEESAAEVLVLRLNTPGGLVVSTREIITLILESEVPVVGYVAPSGAHAASAGTYIMYATHLAGMAPGTNLGAATPIALGGPSPGNEDGEDGGDQEETSQPSPGLEAKSVNDAVAFIRSLAELRGRNADWAEAAVREAASLSANGALDENVIEFLAADLTALLTVIDGREVIIKERPRALNTEGLRAEIFEQDFLTEVLAILSNPNVALILMMIGVYGLFFEFANPGTIGPGVIGAIALVLGLYALNQLPLNYAGLLLIVLGIAFMVAEAFTPTMGALGAGGVVAFIIGAAMLIDTDFPAFQISWGVIIGTGVVSGAILVLLLGYVWRAHHRPLATGAEHLLGSSGRVMEWSDGEGFVWAEGERWQAKGDTRLKPGDEVLIKNKDGLTLTVTRPQKKGDKR